MNHQVHLVRGFRFSGVHGGVRPEGTRRDVALAISDVPAAAAGVFTQNRVRAAPVRVCQERLPSEGVRGVVVCAGNANACTGEQGLVDARRMTRLVAGSLGCGEEQVLVCSTGVIGVPLPMAKVESGIALAMGELTHQAEGVDAFAHAITTTDTRIKVASQQVQLDGAAVNLLGVAKGAAMIGPNMATMLAFVFTDARVAADDLHRIARHAAAQTFNCVRVEGHTSTNDTLLLFANGQANPDGQPLQGADLARFEAAATRVCADLARAIAEDAEGADHLVVIEVEGLRTQEEARRVGVAVADSALVKTAIFGADPNWGRIVSAAGYAGVDFEEEDLSLWLGDLLLYQNGTPQPFDAATASAYLRRERTIHLRLRFTLGSAACTIWTCDLTHAYVRLNAEYTT